MEAVGELMNMVQGLIIILGTTLFFGTWLLIVFANRCKELEEELGRRPKKGCDTIEERLDRIICWGNKTMAKVEEITATLSRAATAIDNLTTDIEQIVAYVTELKESGGADQAELNKLAAMADSLTAKAEAADAAAEAAKKVVPPEE